MLAKLLALLLLGGQVVSFTKPEPKEVAFSEGGKCFVRALKDGSAVEVDSFICTQLAAEAQRKWDLNHMKFPRRTDQPTDSSNSGSWYGE